MKKTVHHVEVNIQTPPRAKSKRTQRNTKSPKKTGKTGTPPPKMDKAVEYWWICAELARFLATTTQEQFRMVCRRGDQFVRAILQDIRQMMPRNPALETADVFLSCEGWNYAQQVWLMGDGDQGMAHLLLGRYQMAGNSCDEDDITQAALLRWNCLDQSHLFERSGKDEAAALGVQYPPANFSVPSISNLATILATIDVKTTPATEQDVPAPTTPKSTPNPGEADTSAPKKAKGKRTRGKAINPNIKKVIARWLNDDGMEKPKDIGWRATLDKFSESPYYAPYMDQYLDSLPNFKRLVQAVRKDQARQRRKKGG